MPLLFPPALVGEVEDEWWEWGRYISKVDVVVAEGGDGGLPVCDDTGYAFRCQ